MCCISSSGVFCGGIGFLGRAEGGRKYLLYFEGSRFGVEEDYD